MPDASGAISELRVALEELYGARLSSILIYGSYARAEATADSDIDILVVLRGDVNVFHEIERMTDAAYPIELEHSVLFSLTPVSRADFDANETPLLRNVHREGVAA